MRSSAQDSISLRQSRRMRVRELTPNSERDEAAQPQLSDEGRRLPMTVRYSHSQALAAPATAVAASIVGGGPGVVW